MPVLSHYMKHDTIVLVKMLYFNIKTICALIINLSKIFEKPEGKILSVILNMLFIPLFRHSIHFYSY
jgi:hypothetical protein